MKDLLKGNINGVNALQFFNLLRFGTTILLMVVLAKFLPQEEIAIYEMFWFIVSMLSFFWVSSTINAALTYLPKLLKEDQKKALFNIFLFFITTSVLISGLLYFGSDWFTQTFGVTEELPYIPHLCLFLVFQSPSWLIQIFYLLLKKYKSIVVYGSIAFGLQIVAVVVPLLMNWGLEEIFIGLILLGLMKFLWLLFLVFKHTTLSLDFSITKPFLLLAIPLIMKSLLGHGYEYIDGLIVTSYFTDENEFAIFRYGAREMPYVTLFIGAIVTAMLPEIALDLQRGMETLKQRTKEVMQWMFPLSAVLMLLSPYLFEYIFNPEFRASAFVFNVYLLMIASRILLPQVVVMAKEQNYFLVLSALVEVSINILLSFIFVRYFGLMGIAFASVIAFFVNKINMIVFLKKKYNISPSQYVEGSTYFMYVALLYGSFGLSLFLYQ